MKNNPLNNVLLSLEDFRTNIDNPGFTGLVEHYDQVHGTDTFGQIASLQIKISKMSGWGKLFTNFSYLEKEIHTPKALCKHYTELVHELQGFEDLYEVEKKIQARVMEVLEFKKTAVDNGTLSTLNSLRCCLGRALDLMRFFGYTEEELGLCHCGRENDWVLKETVHV